MDKMQGAETGWKAFNRDDTIVTSGVRELDGI